MRFFSAYFLSLRRASQKLRSPGSMETMMIARITKLSFLLNQRDIAEEVAPEDEQRTQPTPR